MTPVTIDVPDEQLIKYHPTRPPPLPSLITLSTRRQVAIRPYLPRKDQRARIPLILQPCRVDAVGEGEDRFRLRRAHSRAVPHRMGTRDVIEVQICPVEIGEAVVAEPEQLGGVARRGGQQLDRVGGGRGVEREEVDFARRPAMS